MLNNWRCETNAHADHYHIKAISEVLERIFKLLTVGKLCLKGKRHYQILCMQKSLPRNDAYPLINQDVNNCMPNNQFL